MERYPKLKRLALTLFLNLCVVSSSEIVASDSSIVSSISDYFYFHVTILIFFEQYPLQKRDSNRYLLDNNYKSYYKNIARNDFEANDISHSIRPNFSKSLDLW